MRSDGAVKRTAAALGSMFRDARHVRWKLLADERLQRQALVGHDEDVGGVREHRRSGERLESGQLIRVHARESHAGNCGRQWQRRCDALYVSAGGRRPRLWPLLIARSRSQAGAPAGGCP